ncbi:MAG TPA: metal-sensitive transcriptional regulator [Woeseiaceae bacterium]|nr:metal-sensitive transcriptional regulator [Woeseiaceae bacterium]
MEYIVNVRTPNQDAAMRRLRKIEGQVRGISRMIEEDRQCIEILHQVQAVRSALNKVETVVLKGQADACIEEAARVSDPARQRRQFAELVELFERTKR